RYTCGLHGVGPPGPRSPAALAAGQFEPPCPACGGLLTPALVNEDAPLDPRNTYAVTKVSQEHLADVWARETGGSAVSLRLHNVYGPGLPRHTPYAGVAAIFVSSLERGEAPRVFEDGGQCRDFVHVRDVAAAFVTALTADEHPGRHEAFNVGSGVVSTIGEVARALATSRHGPPPVVTGQYRLGDVRHITASSELIAEQLGWRASIPLELGLEDLGVA
ncbi:MAG: NAD-dependent epimerase/dehydratase family protein, partial [Oryzihumus sp.]